MKNSNGIDFFPVSVDFFEDDKVQLIEAEFGHKGSYLAIRLLCKMYKFDGYFYQWGRDECLLLAKQLGAEFSSTLVDEIINGLLRRGFFCKSVFESFGCLTSRGMQYRYFEAVRRRQVVPVRKELLLMDVSAYPNVQIIGEGNKPEAGQEAHEESAPAAASPAAPADAPQPSAPVAAPAPQPRRARRTVQPVMDEFAEKIQIIEYFCFDKNFYLPCKQFKKCVNWNNGGGRNWGGLNHAQRVSAATMWKQKLDDNKTEETRKKFTNETLPIMRTLYYVCVKEGMDNETRADFLLDNCNLMLKKTFKNNPDKEYNVLRCTRRVWDFICKNHEKILPEYDKVCDNGLPLSATYIESK